MNKPLVIILVGAPGSGKGTQAQELSRAFHMPHISTGDLFRENLSKKTPIGKKAQGFMDKGQLVPDEIVIEMLFDRIKNPDCKNGYILDGFPRTLAQAEAFLSKTLKSDLLCINLKIDDQVIIERMSGRLVCQKCSAPYHKITLPPKKDNICDNCSSPLMQRNDDKESVVKERLRIYHKETEPIIAFLEKELGSVVTIDSSQPKEQITRQLLKQIQVHRKNT